MRAQALAAAVWAHVWLARLVCVRCASLSPSRTGPAETNEKPLSDLYGGAARSEPELESDGDVLRQAFIHPEDETWHQMGWNSSTGPCSTDPDWDPDWDPPWIGADCDDGDGRVTTFILQYPINPEQISRRPLPDLSALTFELGPAIGNLTSLRTFALTDLAMFTGTLPKELGKLQSLTTFVFYNNPKLSGTIPWELGWLAELTVLSLYANPRISGTLPANASLTALKSLYLTYNTMVSGTIPSFAKLTSLQELYLGGNPNIAGTIPGAIGSLTTLQELDLQDLKQVTGTIPREFGNLKDLQQLYLSNSGYEGPIPETLGNMRSLTNLYLDRNPSISGSLPATLAQLTQLHRFDCFDNVALGGSLPTFGGYTSLRQLDVHNCSFTKLPGSLPHTLTHAYLNNNPINAHTSELSTLLSSIPNASVHVLEVGLVTSRVQLVGNGPDTGTGFGTRVSNPSPCTIGELCAFVLHLYDEFDRPLSTGGMVSNLAIGLNGTNSRSQMQDNRDGTFTAQIPGDWVTRPGKYLFLFYNGSVEFKPIMKGPHTLAVGPDCLNVPSGRFRKFGGNCTALRTVEYKMRCEEFAQPVGTSCECKSGYVSYERINASAPLRCHKECASREKLDDNGVSCVCADGYYDTNEHGVLVCNKGEWDATANHIAVQTATRQRRQGTCATKCPELCTSCVDGIPTVKENWRLNFTYRVDEMSQKTAQNAAKEYRELLQNARGSHVQVVFSCPSEADCPQLPLIGAPESGPPDDETVPDVMCPHHHAGPLCAACEPHYRLSYGKEATFKLTKSACIECENASDYIKSTFGVAPGWFAVIAVVAGALGCTLLYRTRQHLRRLKVNFRIILGAAQVWSLLPAVLQMSFPGSSGYVMRYLALLVLDMRDIVRFECWGWNWHTRWLMSVLVLPFFATLPIAGFWLWQQRKIKRREFRARKRAYKRAWSRTNSALLFVAMILYPQLSSSIFSALRCRKLGPELSVMEADYSEEVCVTDSVNAYSVLAVLLVLLVPLGLPIGLFALLRSQRTKSARAWNIYEAAGTAMPADMAAIVQASGTQLDFQQKKAGDAFGFCVEDYREQCYWYEPVDMVRKLSLSGLLQGIHRGTAAQCFYGCGIAFISCGLQQWLQPYREWESNALKVCVDTQLFLTFLITVILRVLPQVDIAEPFDPEDYGWLLVGSLVLLLLAFVGLTTSEARRNRICARARVTFVSTTIQDCFASIANKVSLAGASGTSSDPQPNSTASNETSRNMDAATHGHFTEEATVPLLNLGRSRASSLDDEPCELEPEPEQQSQRQLGFLSGAE